MKQFYTLLCVLLFTGCNPNSRIAGLWIMDSQERYGLKESPTTIPEPKLIVRLYKDGAYVYYLRTHYQFGRQILPDGTRFKTENGHFSFSDKTHLKLEREALKLELTKNRFWLGVEGQEPICFSRLRETDTIEFAARSETGAVEDNSFLGLAQAMRVSRIEELAARLGNDALERAKQAAQSSPDSRKASQY